MRAKAFPAEDPATLPAPRTDLPVSDERGVNGQSLDAQATL